MTQSKKPAYEIITKPTKALAKALHLTFDKTHGYCISDAYVNDKGVSHPSYMYHNGVVYSLKYVSGCFHPYLVFYYNTSDFGAIMSDDFQIKTVIRYNPNMYHTLVKMHKGNFSPL